MVIDESKALIASKVRFINNKFTQIYKLANAAKSDDNPENLLKEMKITYYYLNQIKKKLEEAGYK